MLDTTDASVIVKTELARTRHRSFLFVRIVPEWRFIMQKAQLNGSESSYSSILAAVERLAKTYSYSKMTVRRICNEADVSTGTFYHFFHGKTELISTHLNSGHQERADNIERLVQNGSTLEKLRVFTTNYAAMNIEAGVEELKSLLSPTENWNHNRQPMLNVLLSIISEGQLNGTFVNNVPAVEFAEIAITFLRGCSYCWCVKEGAFNLEARMQLLMGILTHAIIDVMNVPMENLGVRFAASGASSVEEGDPGGAGRIQSEGKVFKEAKVFKEDLEHRYRDKESCAADFAQVPEKETVKTLNSEDSTSMYYDRLVVAVDTIMNRDGYDNVTVRKVCKEAGLAPGTFYRCFSGKTELLNARLDKDNLKRAGSLEVQLLGQDAVQKVYSFAKYYAEMNCEAEPAFHLVMFTPIENWQRKRQPLTDLLEAIFTEGQTKGEMNDFIEPGELAELFIDILRGCVHCWCVQQRSFGLADRMEKITRLFMHSISLTL